MKLHHIFAYVFLALAVAVLVIRLAVEHRVRLRLSGEHQALELEWQKMEDLAARNEQLSNRLAQALAPKPLRPEELRELLRLRAEVGDLRQHKSDLDQERKENRQMHAVLARYEKSLAETNVVATADYWPQKSWTNSGYGSPDAALQTMLWAGQNGDLTNFMAGVDIDARTNFDSMFKGKSATEASIRLADDTSAVQSVQILEHEVLDDNTVRLTVELEGNDGFQTVKMVLKRNGDEWKFAGPQ